MVLGDGGDDEDYDDEEQKAGAQEEEERAWSLQRSILNDDILIDSEISSGATHPLRPARRDEWISERKEVMVTLACSN